MSWLVDHEFLRLAYLAGTAIAVACGLVGWFLVARGQMFAGDALSHVAFTGALAALTVGLSPRWGLYASAVVVAATLSILGGRRIADDVVIGNLFTWVLGAGVLLLSIYAQGHGDNAGAGVRVLFGSVFGLSSADAIEAAAVSAGLVVVMVLLARPLLFTTFSPAVAAARGVPVGLLGFAFLTVAGLAAGEAVQVTGALALLGLLAGPAATAQLLTDRPYRSLLYSVALSVAAVWIGLALSYAVPDLPPSSAVVGVSVAGYLGVLAGRRMSRVDLR